MKVACRQRETASFESRASSLSTYVPPGFSQRSTVAPSESFQYHTTASLRIALTSHVYIIAGGLDVLDEHCPRASMG